MHSTELRQATLKLIYLIIHQVKMKIVITKRLAIWQILCYPMLSSYSSLNHLCYRQSAT